MLQRTVLRVRWLLAAFVLVTLTACSSNMSDLQAYIDSVKARPGGRIAPLPEIQPAPTFTYKADGRRSPFVPPAPQRTTTGPKLGPDPNRPREFLEQFPLDTLKMVGTLDLDGTNYGLVQTKDGLIHRVKVGNHMGENYGRITSITDSEIKLVEIVPDGLGGYINRPAGVGLSD